jgi:hypothetical protein
MCKVPICRLGLSLFTFFYGILAHFHVFLQTFRLSLCCYRVITHEKQDVPNLLLLLYCKPDKPGGEYSFIEENK